MERVCQGVVMQERMCRVFAAPQYPTKAELTCIKDEVVLQQYVQKFPEVLMTKGACRNAYKMTACSNVSLFCSGAVFCSAIQPIAFLIYKNNG